MKFFSIFFSLILLKTQEFDLLLRGGKIVDEKNETLMKFFYYFSGK
jgi:hypothetical protein